MTNYDVDSLEYYNIYIEGYNDAREEANIIISEQSKEINRLNKMITALSGKFPEIADMSYEKDGINYITKKLISYGAWHYQNGLNGIARELYELANLLEK